MSESRPNFFRASRCLAFFNTFELWNVVDEGSVENRESRRNNQESNQSGIGNRNKRAHNIDLHKDTHKDTHKSAAASTDFTAAVISICIEINPVTKVVGV